MRGRSTDFTRYALPALQKQRILVTFTKSQPKRSGGHYPSATAATQSQWMPPQSRFANKHNSLSSKHHPSVSTTGASPTPAICMPLPPADGVQPIFMPTAVAPVLPLPAPPTSAGWTVAGPRHAPPRLPVPGTGVFLPPGSGNIPNQTSANQTSSDESFSSQAEKDNGTTTLSSQAETDNGTTTLGSNDNAAPDLDKKSEKMSAKDCSGTNDEQLGEEIQQDVVVKVANDAAETILSRA